MSRKPVLEVRQMYESDDCFEGSFRGWESKGHHDPEAFVSAVIDAVREWDGTWVDIDPRAVFHTQGYVVPANRNNGAECATFYPTSLSVKRGMRTWTGVWLKDLLPLWPVDPEGLYASNEGVWEDPEA